MMRRRRVSMVVLLGGLVVASAPACKRGAPPAAPAPDARVEPAAPKVELPARGAGMDDPFARMTADSVKSLNAAYAALRAKKPDEARAAFAAVVAAHPDHTAARFQELRAAALAGHPADVVPLWGELLTRDFVAYRGRLDQAKDLAPLRASPEWARLRAIEDATRPAYAAGLAHGAFFAARARTTGAPAFDAAGTAKLATTQEAYHYDLATGRYRRLSETGGQVFALYAAPDRKTLALLVVPALARLPNGKVGFRDPRGLLLNLATLEASGPAAFGPAGFTAGQITMCPSATGEALWVVREGETTSPFAFDATGSALVRANGQACAPDAGTEAAPDGVRRLRPEDGRAHLSESGDLLEIDGETKPIRLARPVEPASLSWSPGGKRLAYAGLSNPCASSKKNDRNELYLWDADKKRPVRIASAVSRFESVWLDDDHLLYEGGLEGAARLLVHDVAAGRAAPLKVRAGAGLAGFPSAACDEDHDHAGDEGSDPREPNSPEDDVGE
jgi:hypothetical protein